MNADLLEQKRLSPDKIENYETIIYGGGIYAGSIAGIKLIRHVEAAQSVIDYLLGVHK